jgi:hypothetical protein
MGKFIIKTFNSSEYLITTDKYNQLNENIIYYIKNDILNKIKNAKKNSKTHISFPIVKNDLEEELNLLNNYVFYKFYENNKNQIYKLNDYYITLKLFNSIINEAMKELDQKYIFHVDNNSNCNNNIDSEYELDSKFELKSQFKYFFI